MNVVLPMNPEVLDVRDFNDALEFSVLGTLILAPEAFAEVRQLKPSHFSRPAHRVIFIVLKNMLEANLKIDLVTIRDEFGPERLSEVGGIEYLVQLCEIVPDPNNIAEYARRLVEGWAIRQYAALGVRARQPDATLDELRIIAESIVEDAVLPNLNAVVGRLGSFGAGAKRRGITMGYGEDLDVLFTSNGYPEGQTTVVSSYHKGGKTSWMLGSALAQAKLGYSVLLATFADMGGADLEERAMKFETGWSFCPNRLDLQADWLDTRSQLRTQRLIDVYDPGALDSGYDIETFVVWLRYRMAKQPYDCVFVDYAQELSSGKVPDGDEYRTARVCASTLQRLARKLSVPIVIGSQITEGRNGERDKTKGSRVWEEKAGVVLRIKREASGDGAQVDVPYSRFGPADTVFLRWNRDRVRFEPRAG